MIYYTGDIHGQKHKVVRFCKRIRPAKEDVIVILGDVGANYFQDERDDELKKALNELKPTILCIHGNHEIRPWNIPTYKTKEWNGGIVWYEEAYPSLLFAKDGEIYTIEGLRHIAIGGAYSVDKFYRISRGYGWWEDEQPYAEIKKYVEQQLHNNKVDVILSHTCPYKYEPVDAFLPGIDQSTVDISTEKWLDKIEETTDYLMWFCGHWHINRKIAQVHFLFDHFRSSEEMMAYIVVKRVSNSECGFDIGDLNILTEFAVRYAFDGKLIHASVIERFVQTSLEGLHPQTKRNIVRYIEAFIERYEYTSDIEIWNRIKATIEENLRKGN